MKTFPYALPGLNQKVAIVTGHKQDIGLATKTLLENLGVTVVGFDLPEFDLSKLAKIETYVRSVVDEHGKIDILVNNAGIIRVGNLLEISAEDMDAVLDLNFKAAMMLMKAVIPVMVKQRQGAIINNTSRSSFDWKAAVCDLWTQQRCVGTIDEKCGAGLGAR